MCTAKPRSERGTSISVSLTAESERFFDEIMDYLTKDQMVRPSKASMVRSLLDYACKNKSKIWGCR